MATAEMLMVFCYDVSDDRRRRRIVRLLEDAAVRVQKSVFEARMTEQLANRLATDIARHLAVGDSLRVYAIGARGLARSRSYGGAPLAELQDFYLL